MPALTAAVWDKGLHAIGYAALAILVCRALQGEGVGWRRAVVAALLLTSAYAVTDEWHQSLVPGRDSDVRDWVADSLGAILGSVAYAGFVALKDC